MKQPREAYLGKITAEGPSRGTRWPTLIPGGGSLEHCALVMCFKSATFHPVRPILTPTEKLII